MAAITAVASACTSGVQPRYAVVGPVTVYSEYTITATLSTADIIRICKIPDKARVISVQVAVPNTLHVNAKLNIGTAADHDLFIASATAATARVFGYAESAAGGFGYQLDTTDSATTRYTELRLKVSDADSTTGTTAGTLKFLVTYMNDEGPY